MGRQVRRWKVGWSLPIRGLRLLGQLFRRILVRLAVLRETVVVVRGERRLRALLVLLLMGLKGVCEVRICRRGPIVRGIRRSGWVLVVIRWRLNVLEVGCMRGCHAGAGVVILESGHLKSYTAFSSSGLL